MADLDDLPPGEPQGAEDDRNPSLTPDEIAQIDALVEYLESDLRRNKGQSAARTRIRLGVMLYRRYSSLRDPASLNKAISELDLAARDAESPENGWALAYLATCHSRRYRDLADSRSLSSAIKSYRDALKLIPGSEKSWWVYANLADALRLRYELIGNRSSLDEAIDVCKMSLRFASEKHAPRILVLFSRCAIDAYDGYGDTAGLAKVSDDLLNVVTQLSREPEGDHVLKGTLLVNLGDVHLRRYESLGDLGCLDRAINSYQEALKARVVLDYPVVLSNLGNALCARHARSNNLSDLDAAIELLALAADSTPRVTDAAARRTLHYCNSLLLRYNATGSSNKRDLDLAINQLRQAIVTCRSDSPVRPHMLSVLGNALLVDKSSRQTSVTNEEIVRVLRLAGALSSPTLHDRPYVLARLATALAAESDASNESRGEAARHFAEALLMIPQTDPQYTSINEALSRVTSVDRRWNKLLAAAKTPHRIVVAISPGTEEPCYEFSGVALALQSYLRSLDLDGVESVLDREPPENSPASSYPEAGALTVNIEPRQEKLFALLEVLTHWSNANHRRVEIAAEADGVPLTLILATSSAGAHEREASNEENPIGRDAREGD